MQCHKQLQSDCQKAIWPTDPAQYSVLRINSETDRVEEDCPLPKCIHCGSIARPNVLMFGDFDFIANRQNEQLDNYYHWLREIPKTDSGLVVVEIGAGTAIPTVRRECEDIVSRFGGAKFIRINPDDFSIPSRLKNHSVSIPLDGLNALIGINELMQSL